MRISEWRTRLGRLVRATDSRAAFGLLIASMVSRALGYVRELLMAAYFATSVATDAWLMASIVPNLLIQALSNALDNVLIPMLVRIREADGPEAVIAFSADLLGWLTVMGLVASLVLVIAMPLVIRLLAPGFHGHEYRLAVLLARIMMPVFLFWLWRAVGLGMLQAAGSYVATGWSQVAQNIGRILLIVLLAPTLGIRAAAIGFAVGTASQLFVLVPELRRARLLTWPTLGPFRTAVGAFFRRAWTAIVSSMANTGGLVVDRILASTLATGNIAALNFASILVQVPVTLVLQAVITPLFTRLSTHQARGEQEAWGRLVRRLLVGTIIMMALIAIGLSLFAHPIIALAYRRGAFEKHSTVLTARVVPFFALGLPGSALNMIGRKAAYSSGDVLTPARWAIVVVVLNIVADLILIRPLGARGLALGTSFAISVAAAGITWPLWRGRARSPFTVKEAEPADPFPE
ncbi:MAG: murein biosynthesis integral membrane protein MurJ [Clostridia bacterium]